MKLRDVPGARRVAAAVLPSRRAVQAQWDRIDRAISVDTVQSGPFAGMRVVGRFTGSHIPKRLGSYEEELHELIWAMEPYDTVLDVGCGEGFYVVGLARLWPTSDVHGFDISPTAQRECQETAKASGVKVTTHGPATPRLLEALVSGRTLILCDAEGAEVEVLDPAEAPGLHQADLLVELHDFAVPGIEELLRRRFPNRRAQRIAQRPRSVTRYPLLEGLSPEDARRALDESRVADQAWLWLPA